MRRSRREFLNWTGKLAAGSALLGLGVTSPGAEPQGQSREWFGGPVWPPLEKVEAVLQRWARQYPDRMKLDAAGRSSKGKAVWAIKLTDPSTDGVDGGKAPAAEGRIEHGLCLRLRIPYGKAEIVDLRLNGHPVPASDSDGFARWTDRGCTFVQINLAPERLRSEELFLVTCQYDPRQRRGHWNTWREPAPKE